MSPSPVTPSPRTRWSNFWAPSRRSALLECRPCREYRPLEGLTDLVGTAVVVQAMVFGNLGVASGSGVGFTAIPPRARTGSTSTSC